VLVPGGELVLSTHHPTMDWQLIGGNYFETRQHTETWHKSGVPVTVTYWRRPLTAMIAAFRASGFVIDDIEPSEAVDTGREMVDLYGYTSMAVAALQTQVRDIEALKREVADLRRQLARRIKSTR